MACGGRFIWQVSWGEDLMISAEHAVEAVQATRMGWGYINLLLRSVRLFLKPVCDTDILDDNLDMLPKDPEPWKVESIY